MTGVLSPALSMWDRVKSITYAVENQISFTISIDLGFAVKNFKQTPRHFSRGCNIMGKCYLQKCKLMKNIGFYILERVQLQIGRINYNKKTPYVGG